MQMTYLTMLGKIRKKRGWRNNSEIALAALPDDLSSVPRIHIRLFTRDCNTSSRGSLLASSGSLHSDSPTHTQTHIRIIKEIKVIFNWEEEIKKVIVPKENNPLRICNNFKHTCIKYPEINTVGQISSNWIGLGDASTHLSSKDGSFRQRQKTKLTKKQTSELKTAI